jgi:hypothetical protein
MRTRTRSSARSIVEICSRCSLGLGSLRSTPTITRGSAKSCSPPSVLPSYGTSSQFLSITPKRSDPHRLRRIVLMLTISKLVQVFRQEIAGDSNRQSLQMNVYDYTTRATMDITGDSESTPHILPLVHFIVPNSGLRVSIRCSR